MQLIENKHLTLTLVRLKRREVWTNDGAGFSFVLVKGGNGQYVSDLAAKDLLPGDVLVLGASSEGKIAVASDEMIFWCFSVCFEHLFPLFDVGEICLLQDTTENLNGQKLYPASSALAQECHRLVASTPPQGNVDHRSQVLRVAAAVLSAEFKNTRSNRAGFVRMEDHMMQVFEELSTTELLTLSVGEMAHKFSCSRRHLNRLFHQHFGCSVASLRMEMRLMKALSLLRDPNMKIINVAEQCGFNHLGLFNACFKKRFGNTPGQWRKSDSPGETSAHDNGLYSMKPKSEDRTPTKQKKNPMQKTSQSSAPANSKLRETIIRNISKVSAQITFQSNPGANLQIRL